MYVYVANDKGASSLVTPSQLTITIKDQNQIEAMEINKQQNVVKTMPFV